MKYIILTIALVLFLVSPQVVNAQEIDFDVLFQTLHDIQTKIDTMISLARIAQESKVTVQFVGDIVFTAGQQQILVDQYATLKAKLATLYQQLP